jgi:signal transduction histidine kinase
MSKQDLSSLRAIIADDRAAVRDLLANTLRSAGVSRIDAVPGMIGVERMLAVLTGPSSHDADEPERAPVSTRDLIARFSHDVASPLMLIVALSDLLARQPAVDDRVRDDLQQIHSAAREVATMVRGLGMAAGPRAGGASAGS